MNTAPTRVCFVGGVGRSGSTLLELLLAQVPGTVTLGETIHLLERGLAADERCTCGESFSRCALWAAVGEAAFGGWPYDCVDELLALQRQVDKHRYVPRLLHPRGAFATRLDAYVGGFLEPVLAAAARVTGAWLVVDTSKHPSHEMVLDRSPGLDVRTVHLVRRPEGVAYSWSKEVRRPEVASGDVSMPRYSAGRSALRWVAWNSLLELEARRRHRTLRLRYEDLVADPEAAVDGVVRHCGGVPGREGAPPVVHGIGGNPVRFGGGVPVIRADDGWREGLTPAQRRLVVALSAPLRRAYGYAGAA
ncbi:MAG: sulfotransferase [Actinobacteria bacterium]|nr:sulfotransferase [Actinomycetota bacterium]